MDSMVDEVLRFIDQMEPEHWLLALAAAIVLGYVLMKGVGSRSQY